MEGDSVGVVSEASVVEHLQKVRVGALDRATDHREGGRGLLDDRIHGAEHLRIAIRTLALRQALRLEEVFEVGLVPDSKAARSSPYRVAR